MRGELALPVLGQFGCAKLPCVKREATKRQAGKMQGGETGIRQNAKPQNPEERKPHALYSLKNGRHCTYRQRIHTRWLCCRLFTAAHIYVRLGRVHDTLIGKRAGSHAAVLPVIFPPIIRTECLAAGAKSF